MISAVQKSVLESYRRFFKSLGMKLRVSAPRECAYSNLIREYEMSNPDVLMGENYCFLDIGHSATRIYIYSGQLYRATRVIEYGGAMVESAIARDLSVDLATARTYKENSQEATRYLQETSTAYNSIALEIRKAISFYNSDNETRIERIYCCGGGCSLAPLLDSITETVGLEICNIRELFPWIRGEETLSEICAAAVGITLE